MIAVYQQNLVINQSRYDTFSHRGINGTDLNGNFYLPFDCIIRRSGVNQSKAVYVVLESAQKWQTVCEKYNDYITLCFVHMNKSVGGIGKILKKGTQIKVGNSGISSGNHLHMELGLGKISGNTFVSYETKFNLKTPLNIENAFYLKKGKSVKYNFGAKKTPFTTEREQMTYYAKIKYDLTSSRFKEGGYSWFLMEFTRTPAIFQDFEAKKIDKAQKFKVGQKQVSRPCGWNKKGWFMHSFISANDKTYYYAYIVKGK